MASLILELKLRLISRKIRRVLRTLKVGLGVGLLVETIGSAWRAVDARAGSVGRGCRR